MTKASKALKRAHAATTPGEWQVFDHGGEGVCAREGGSQTEVCYSPFKPNDAAFIALARNMAPGIIEMLEIIENKPDEAEQMRRGEMLADVLGLNRDRDGRYRTAWGTKTSLGLYLTVQRITERGE